MRNNSMINPLHGQRQGVHSRDKTALQPAETLAVPGSDQVHQARIEIVTVLVTCLGGEKMSAGVIVQLVYALAAATGEEYQRADTETGQHHRNHPDHVQATLVGRHTAQGVRQYRQANGGLRRGHPVKHKAGEIAGHEHHCRQDHHGPDHARGRLLDIDVLQPQLAKEGIVDQLVDTENGAERADDGTEKQQRAAVNDQRAVDQPLGDKTVHRRQTRQADNTDEHGDKGQRHARHQPAQLVEIRGTGAMNHRRDRHEQ
jgi:hypothetical protein